MNKDTTMQEINAKRGDGAAMSRVDHTPPYENCSFRLCDLPGQCRGEGKCHHPATTPVAAQAHSVSDTLNFAAQVIELYDDATMNDRDHMLDSTDCAGVLVALGDYLERFPVAAQEQRIVFPSHLRKMWSGTEVQEWLDEKMGAHTPKPSAKGSLERYRQYQREQSQQPVSGADVSGCDECLITHDKQDCPSIAAQPQPSGNAAHYDAIERALTELVDKIVPGLDTGDLVADAAAASKALDREQPSGAAEQLNIEAAARVLAECFDYPWDHIPQQGRESMIKYAMSVVNAALTGQKTGGES